MFKSLTLLIITCSTLITCFGNNLQISPVTISFSGSNQYLNFTISWDNSWRVSNNPGNWDAVWIFVKRRDCAALQWKHADLSDVDADHSSGVPLLVDAYADKKGVMVFRSTNGSGTINSVAIQLKLDSPPLGNYEYKVLGIEMVHIPQGAFYIGDGLSSFSFKTGTSSIPFLITGETSISISSSGTDLWNNVPGQNPFVLPSTYPKGYNAFYCMKYEISQGQYTDFLNTINQDAFQNHYDPNDANTFRNTITGSWPVMITPTPNRACNWLSIDDLNAYLDWSALSPMTELEFEKICRGNSTNLPVAGECAWGGNQITDANTITLGTDGQPNENVSDPILTGAGLANFNNNSILGPLRCGFAAKPSTTRFESGAAFYGAMEMSGNVYEFCINADSSTFGKGYTFNGSHGDGELSTTPVAGYANQNWPGQTALDFTEQYFSYCVRGGAWTSSSNGAQLSISERSAYVINGAVPAPNNKGRSVAFGGRGVSRRQ